MLNNFLNNIRSGKYKDIYDEYKQFKKFYDIDFSKVHIDEDELIRKYNDNMNKFNKKRENSKSKKNYNKKKKKKNEKLDLSKVKDINKIRMMNKKKRRRRKNRK